MYDFVTADSNLDAKINSELQFLLAPHQAVGMKRCVRTFLSRASVNQLLTQFAQIPSVVEYCCYSSFFRKTSCRCGTRLPPMKWQPNAFVIPWSGCSTCPPTRSSNTSVTQTAWGKFRSIFCWKKMCNRQELRWKSNVMCDVSLSLLFAEINQVTGTQTCTWNESHFSGASKSNCDVWHSVHLAFCVRVQGRWSVTCEDNFVLFIFLSSLYSLFQCLS